MIRMAGPADLPVLQRLCGGDPFGCRILSLANAYGFDKPFAGFWLQSGEEGPPHTAICRLDQSAVVCPGQEARQKSGSQGCLNGYLNGCLNSCSNSLEECLESWQEAAAFVRALGCTAALAPWNRHAAQFWPPEQVATGPVMRLAAPAGGRRGRSGRIKNVPKEPPSLLQIHGLLAQCAGPGFSPPPRDAFYVDMSHRVRHGAARAVALTQPAGEASGDLAACALTVAETSAMAVIGAVACSPALRGQGLGRAALDALCAQLSAEGKQAYLFCLPQLRRFYEAAGFVAGGCWMELSFS
ncbi:MAG TPA: GNAT family N-acetyltransferase [Candidatus Gallacutalibacter stercoravium]|nr:GNAT family N-acetyltransferase [Candidatus Gallacutalibacter stercoravium]